MDLINREDAIRWVKTERNPYRKPTNRVMNTYLTGFKAGIKQVLEKQCTALMIVTPQKVIDAYDEKVQGAKVHTIKIKSAKDTDAYNEGKFDGKSMIEQKMLAV